MGSLFDIVIGGTAATDFDANVVEVEVEEDVMVDHGSEGEPVGYDIQHASTKADFIARIMR